MYEHHHEKVLPWRLFVRRVFSHVGVAAILVGCALALGMAGYHFIGGLAWVDSLLNASMILGGMGPVDPLTTNAAKVFASFYALFAGLLFIGVLGIVTAPFAHRLMHTLHVEGTRNRKG
jgi:hypothetical protein